MEKRIDNGAHNNAWLRVQNVSGLLRYALFVLLICCFGSYVFADTDMQNSLLTYPVRIGFGRVWGPTERNVYLAPGQKRTSYHGWTLDRVSAEYSTDTDAYWKDAKGRYHFNPKANWKLIATVKGHWTAKQTIVVYPALDTETGEVEPKLSVSGGV